MRILVVQPWLEPFGGGGGVCAWILEALREEHEVSLLTWQRPDFPALNAFFGTGLTPATVRVELAYPRLPGRWRHTKRARRLLHYALLAEARRRKPAMDLLISVEEESDLGGGGVQYVHFPRHAPPRGLRGVYHRLAALATGSSEARMRTNLTLVNSDWTGRLVGALHGIETVTVYPPAAGTFPAVPWADRSDGFVAIGRIVPEKRFELLVDIVAGVRARGRDATLHIIGTPDNAGYEAELVAHTRGKPWVTIARNVSRDELARALTSRRYGLHGMAEEHFGMAIAEIVAAGAIPFVPRGGGQVEITGDERLEWRTPDEAVELILRVLDDPPLQAELRAALAARLERFTPARFVARIRALVRESSILRA